MSAHFDQVKASLDRFCAAWKENDGAALGACFTAAGSQQAGYTIVYGD